MPRTILYARTSTDRQTIALQREAAEVAGFILDEVIVDEGVSGVSMHLVDRPGGGRLHASVQRGDTLVLHDLDRLGRSYADVTDAMRDFMRRGVTVRTVIGARLFDSTLIDPHAMVARDGVIAALAAAAQAQAEAGSIRIRDVKRNLKAKGIYGGGKRPFGFDIDPEGRLIENAAEQAALADMQSRRAAGESFATIGAAIGKPAMSVKRMLDRL